MKSLGTAISVAGVALLGIGLATVPVTDSTPALAGSPSVSVPVSVLGGQGEPEARLRRCKSPSEAGGPYPSPSIPGPRASTFSLVR